MSIDNKLGFTLTVENANKLFDSAELLASNKNYGHAIALLVLSSEEAIKALRIFARAMSLDDFDEDDFDLLFKDHKKKLNLIRSTILLMRTISTIQQLIYNPVLENIDKSIAEIKAARKKGIGDAVAWLKKEAKSNDTDMAKEAEWWRQAKTLKEDCLYVRQNKNYWHSPVKKTKAAYNKARRYVSDFLSLANDVSKVDFESPEITAILSQYRQQTK